MEKKHMIFERGGVRAVFDFKRGYLAEVWFEVDGEYRRILTAENEFSASVGDCCGDFSVREAGGAVIAEMQAENVYYSARSVVTLNGHGLSRRQVYTVRKAFTGYLNPHFELHDVDAKYTYSQRVYDKPVREVSPIRNDYLWALPLPAHMWHGVGYAAVYCLDHVEGKGTCDFTAVGGLPRLGAYYPDRTRQETCILPFSDTRVPETQDFRAGEEVTFCEYVVFASLSDGQNPVLESEKLAVGLLLKERPVAPDCTELAEELVRYYRENGLWNPDALGKGRGWYRNMWKHTNGGTPEKDFYYDLGWGEGYGVLTLSALVRYSRRTGKDCFRRQIEEITRNISLFMRDASEPGAYYDRFVPKGKPSLLGVCHDYELCDFLGVRRIWTHSLAMIGYQLVSLAQEAGGYDERLTKIWLRTARDIGDFLINNQHEDGDINDGFDSKNRECNKKRHRIPARAIACGLLARLYAVTGEEQYAVASEQLAKAVAPEIEAYEFYNQMLDAHVDVFDGCIVESGADEKSEVWDAENACYAFVGLVDEYARSRDMDVLKLCENCAAYFIGWMYFYDIETGVNGRSRGATTCRMPDFPLVYLGAGNFAWSALVKLSELTGDVFYARIAEEMFCCAADYRLTAPGQPWNGGIVHAVYQVTGNHWGPDIEGQMDTGMTSGSTLINVEKFLLRSEK